MEPEASNAQTMDNNAINLILAHLKTMSRDVARLNVGLEKLDTDVESMSGRLEGKSDPEAYLAWESSCDRIFQLNDLTVEKKSCYAIAHFEGLRYLMHQRYLPEGYKQELLAKLYNLRQGNKSVIAYYDEFQQLMLKLDHRGEQVSHDIIRFKVELNRDIASRMTLHKFDTIDGIFQAALGIERELSASKPKNHQGPSSEWHQHQEHSSNANQTENKVVQTETNASQKYPPRNEGGFVVEVGKFVSKCIYPKIENIIRFSSKIENLRTEMEELTALRDDIKRKVEKVEGEGYKRKPDVIKWFEDVQKLKNEWEVMQEHIAAAKTLVYKCCPKCSRRSEVSTQAKNIWVQFCKLKEVGENFGSNLVVENYRVEKAEHILGPSIKGQLTATRNLNKLLRLLEDDEVMLKLIQEFNSKYFMI
ncbi:hypothetical protein FXO37_03728 [Capsicum annuum]|nr:hypothetical protein FXO37_03728 [Capsicum annuum]